jgi:hypothetical protein
MSIWALSLGLKRPEPETDQLLPINAKVKNTDLYIHSLYIFMA